MKVTLYMAITANGYIAKSDDNTDWVCETDWQQLGKYIENSDAVIMGRRTWEISGNDFPYGKCLNVVLTNNKSLFKDESSLLFTDKKPRDVLEELRRRNIKNVLIIGGGKTNPSFLEADLIDKIVFSVHPIVLGEGIKVFSDVNKEVELHLVGVEKFDQDLVHLKYKVKK